MTPQYHILQLRGSRLAGQWWAADWPTAVQLLATLELASDETLHVYALAAPVTLPQVAAAVEAGDDPRAVALLTAWQTREATR